MLVKYIDSDYIIERLQKPSWGEVEEPDFYITMASNRVKALIFPSEQGDPNNLESYTEEQQEAIKLATAIYAMWYFDTNYDFTNGSVSVNFGGVSMSESKTYNGEMVLPNVFDILKQANLIPTTETFIFSGENSLYADTAINPKAFKDLQQEVERQADVNIKQDAKIVDIYDILDNMDYSYILEVKQEIEQIQEEQVEQNKAIENNATEIETTKTDLGDLGGQVIDVQNKTNENTTNIEANTTQIQATSKLLNDTIEELKKQKWVSYKGTYQPGTTYNTGDLVVLNSVFYLSNADNNTTTPPGSQWDIIENPTGGGQIDLSNYYNKQEIDTQQTEQNVKIQANTDALNQKVDLTTAQTITGPKTFNKLVLPDKVFFGPENDPDYTYDRHYGTLSKTNGFDILDDEELVTKAYVDTAYYLSINNTEKKVPGKYLNGKPVYIKYFEYTFPNKKDGEFEIYSRVDKVVSFTGFSTRFANETAYSVIPFYWSPPDSIRLLITTEGRCYIKKYWGENDVRIYGTIEYTKL